MIEVNHYIKEGSNPMSKQSGGELDMTEVSGYVSRVMTGVMTAHPDDCTETFVTSVRSTPQDITFHANTAAIIVFNYRKDNVAVQDWYEFQVRDDDERREAGRTLADAYAAVLLN